MGPHKRRIQACSCMRAAGPPQRPHAPPATLADLAGLLAPQPPSCPHRSTALASVPVAGAPGLSLTLGVALTSSLTSASPAAAPGGAQWCGGRSGAPRSRCERQRCDQAHARLGTRQDFAEFDFLAGGTRPCGSALQESSGSLLETTDAVGSPPVGARRTHLQAGTVLQPMRSAGRLSAAAWWRSRPRRGGRVPLLGGVLRADRRAPQVAGVFTDPI